MPQGALTGVAGGDIICFRKTMAVGRGEGISVAECQRELSMKLEDFAYSVAERTLKLLENEHHYKVPDHVRKEIHEKIAGEIDGLISGKPKSQDAPST
jgi:hypothetical protein